MSEDRPIKKRVKFASASASATSSDDIDKHVKTRSGLSKKATELLSSLGIKEGETYVEIPEADIPYNLPPGEEGLVEVRPDGNQSGDPPPDDLPYGKNWRTAYFKRIQRLKSNLTYAFLDMLAGACGIDITAAVDNSYVDTFRRLSDVQSKIIQREINTTRVDYPRKKQQRDDLMAEIALVEEKKAETGKLATPDATITFRELIKDCLMHAYYTFVYRTIIPSTAPTSGIYNASLADRNVEIIAKLLYDPLTKADAKVAQLPGRTPPDHGTTYIMRFLASLYSLYLRCPTLARDELREYSLESLVELEYALADPRHLKYIAARPSEEEEDGDDSDVNAYDVHLTDNNGLYGIYSDQLKMIYSILHSFVLVTTLTSTQKPDVVYDLDIKVIQGIVDSKFQFPEVFNAIKRVISPIVPGLQRAIDNLREACVTRLLFTTHTTQEANLDLWRFSSEAERDTDEYRIAVLNVVVMVIFTACFTYRKEFTSSLMGLYLCIYSHARGADTIAQMEEHGVTHLGVENIQLIRGMLRRIGPGTRLKPNRISPPDSRNSANPRAILEQYIMPIAAISAMASKPDLERKIEEESEQHKYQPSSIGYLPTDTQIAILRFVTRYFGKRAPKPRKNSKKRKSSEAKGKGKRKDKRPEESSDSEDEDEGAAATAPGADEHSVATQGSKEKIPERLEKFKNSETRKADAFAEFLISYDHTIGSLTYYTLDVMFDRDEYLKALDMWRLSVMDGDANPDTTIEEEEVKRSETRRTDSRPIDFFVQKMIRSDKSADEAFAEDYHQVLFSVLHKFYTKRTEEIRKSLNEDVANLKESLREVNDQLVRIVGGKVGGNMGDIDLLLSPDASLSVLQSGQFIVNPKLVGIMNRVHVSITSDPLFNFKGCPLDALTTPLTGSVLYTIASIFADICGVEYNRRNVADGTIAYAYKNTIDVQKQQLKTSGMNLSYYRWVPGMSDAWFGQLKTSDREVEYFKQFHGWFVKETISSMIENKPKPKHKLTVFLTPSVPYTKYI